MAYLKLNYVELVTLLRKICSPHTITGTCVTPVQKMSLQITLYLKVLATIPFQFSLFSTLADIFAF